MVQRRKFSANLSAVSDPPCDTYVFYESDGTTYIGSSITLDCTDEGVQTTYVVRIAEDDMSPPTNPSLDFLTIHVTPLDNETLCGYSSRRIGYGN